MENGGEQCTTCHQLIPISVLNDLPNPWQSEETRRKIAKICLAQLFSELIDSSLIWKVCNGESQPFCNKCLEELENISKMDDESENIQKQIDDFVDSFTMKSLRSRKEKDKFVISERNSKSTAETVTPTEEVQLSTYGDGEKECCKICSKDYVINNDATDNLEMATVRKIMDVCEKHFFKELISNDCFDWNSIGLKKFLSICGNCLHNIEAVCEMNEELEKAGNDVSTAVEKFVITILKSRKSVKEKGINKYYPDSNSERNSKFPSTPTWDTPAVPALSNYSPAITNQLLLSPIENLNCENEDLIAEDSDNGGKPQIIISNPRSLSLEKNGSPSGIVRQTVFTPTVKMASSSESKGCDVSQKYAGVILHKSVFPAIKLTKICQTKHISAMTTVKLESTTSSEGGPVKKKSRIPKPLRDPAYDWNVKKYKSSKPSDVKCTELSTIRKRKHFNSVIKCTNCPKVFAYVKSFENHAKICQMKISENGDQNSAEPKPFRSFHQDVTTSTAAIFGNSNNIINETILLLPYACKQCGKAFARKNYLANHCRIKKHSAFVL